MDGVLLVSLAPLVPHQLALSAFLVLLAGEAPSTDLTLKRHVLEQAGVSSYWLVDPEAAEVTVLELTDGAYREVAAVRGTQPYLPERPFPAGGARHSAQ